MSPLPAMGYKRIKRRVKRAFRGPPPPEPDTRVGVWEDLKLVYVRIPKCANTSIMRSVDGCEKRRMWASEIASLDQDWTSFSFVRNPWARMVSAYRDKASTDSLSPRMEEGVFQGFREAGLALRADMSFAEFCEVVCSVPDEQTEKHLRSQSSFLVHEDRVIVPFVGKVENMAADWKVVLHRAGLEADLLHLNRTRHSHYSEFFQDPQLVKLVADRYAQDIRRFNYDF